MKTCDPKDFDERCHKLLLKIPIGKVTTYKEIAHALGCRGYRAVGQSLNRKNSYQFLAIGWSNPAVRWVVMP